MAFEPLLYLALGLLILGNGFFKPNISTMVGQLYPQNDPRRDGAYTIFYMGINLGAFFSPLVCGTLGETVRLALRLRRGGRGHGLRADHLHCACQRRSGPAATRPAVTTRANVRRLDADRLVSHCYTGRRRASGSSTPRSPRPRRSRRHRAERRARVLVLLLLASPVGAAS